jgi:hypothetical protein
MDGPGFIIVERRHHSSSGSGGYRLPTSTVIFGLILNEAIRSLSSGSGENRLLSNQDSFYSETVLETSISIK